MLRVNTSLKELDIGNCGIQGSDCVHIAKALEESTTTQLQTLELTYNPIGSEGAAAFACMLKRNQCLKKLDLFCVSLNVEDAIELVEIVKHNTTLEELRLYEKNWDHRTRYVTDCMPPSLATLAKPLQGRVRIGA